MWKKKYTKVKEETNDVVIYVTGIDAPVHVERKGFKTWNVIGLEN